MVNALAYTTNTFTGASWSRSQEWLSRARVLRDSLHSTRPDRTAHQDGGVVERKRRLLQVNGLQGHLEQSGRVGGFGRFHMVAG